MTPGERLYPLRLPTLPPADRCGGISATLGEHTPDERRGFIAEAAARVEAGARDIRERDLPLLRGFW